ncbi:Trypsin-like peptidase domain-containing protein [Streptomyces zhaozhouensis]|uniref:Trypsin-like peptidase domain-containing protein n=1 Tax=Streptomyces zhaozhouensis TaxID=1300267 RepID=A0A286E7C6_9ACTN|nr:trypsin-like peptidase domain-containing protein [Streptomyces zhaozhouensis]SOD66812.1 Trypsin-like peptidase domain-containing protein [Streptomyces zhaozhouensis]
MRPFDRERVAEVVVRRGKHAEYGSGYRIGPTLVLTAGHLLDPPEGEPRCTVLLGGHDTEHPVAPVWRARGRDLALLRLTAPPASPGTGAPVPPVPLGRLSGGTGTVPFTGVGFPAYAQRPGTAGRAGLRRRDSREVGGFVPLGSNIKSGCLDLVFTTSPPTNRGPDGQDPWQGLSGTALFTQDGLFLVGVQSQRLPAAGTGSAEGEPIAVALEDPEFVRLVARDGIRPRAVAIEPPGADRGRMLSAVVPQEELVRGLGDFKKNLDPDHLPFVSPGSEHAADPANLFLTLVTSADRGVLLVGAAGTGKTRTGLEVGRLAMEAGWRVLHVLPGENPSPTDELAEHVLAEPGPVLVVIDYLNESQLDLSALRHRLLPAAHRKGVTVALLASVRPGWLRKSDRAALRELFDEVELRRDDAFQREVTANALTRLAPKAVDALDPAQMTAVCRNRPIIALLIAREIERRIEARLPVPLTAGLRSSGELAGWLERRLSEDGLTVRARKDTFTPARAPLGLVAAAAAAAACPQSRAEVVAAASAALAGAPPEEAPGAESVVATLVSLGWFEGDDELLSVAHDVVADQLVESVVLPERDEVPDAAGVRALLAGGLTHPRTLGRYATNIGRLVNDLSLVDRAGALTSTLDGWFRENAATVGRLLRDDADVGGYALGAICSGPPWHTAAVRCWEEVVGPWLTEFGAGVDARHLLYRGLRHLPPEGGALLVPAALDWLSDHGVRREASYVLGPLLYREDLPPEALERLVDGTFRWLERHVGTDSVDFVLPALLSRDDLPPEAAGRAFSLALTWLERRVANAEVRAVLDRVLARPARTSHDARRTVRVALTWLAEHTERADAGFVLRALLPRPDLTPDEARQVISTALTWLEAHTEESDAGFVLRALLARPDLTPDEAGRVAALRDADGSPPGPAG